MAFEICKIVPKAKYISVWKAFMPPGSKHLRAIFPVPIMT